MLEEEGEEDGRSMSLLYFFLISFIIIFFIVKYVCCSGVKGGDRFLFCFFYVRYFFFNTGYTISYTLS